MTRQYGNPIRTQQQKATSALLWIAGCRPEMLTLTADELCARHGVTSQAQQREVAKVLLRRQLQVSNA